MNEEDIYKASYMQEPFNILTSENLDRLEKHCKKAIHYERKEGLMEHQLTLDLLYKYRDQQLKLEQKDKMIDNMAEYLASIDFDQHCIEVPDICIGCPKEDDLDGYMQCIKQYFERKVKDGN